MKHEKKEKSVVHTQEKKKLTETVPEEAQMLYNVDRGLGSSVFMFSKEDLSQNMGASCCIQEVCKARGKVCPKDVRAGAPQIPVRSLNNMKGLFNNSTIQNTAAGRPKRVGCPQIWVQPVSMSSCGLPVSWEVLGMGLPHCGAGRLSSVGGGSAEEGSWGCSALGLGWQVPGEGK